jgi:GNAT superfamily N-acetyltransferase
VRGLKSARIEIRESRYGDATEIGDMAKDFADYLRSLGDKTNFRFNAESYLRDGFGASPAFQGLVAEVDGQVAGYLLYHFGYDTDRAIRITHVVDLYVRTEFRRQGIGRALMERVRIICKETGGKRLFWSVYSPNNTARKFYWWLGARYTRDMLYMYLRVK